MFTPVQRMRGSRQVVEQIRALIEDGQLQPGERLPAERELAVQFGVSRATLREAVQSLASLGLLEVRQGVGTLVSPHATTLVDPSLWLPWLSDHKQDVIALLDVREALEAKSAALAATAVANRHRNASRGLKRLRDSVAGLEAAVGDDDIIVAERYDLEFHAELAKMSGNDYLLMLSKSINHVFADRRAVMAISGRGAQSVDEHRAILAAIEAGDHLAAAEAIVTHLGSVKATVTELREAREA